MSPDIEWQYGEDGVARFLNALGRAHSLEGAIEAALPVSFGEFNRQWTGGLAENKGPRNGRQERIALSLHLSFPLSDSTAQPANE